MRSTIRTGLCLLVAAAFALAGCSTPSSGTAGEETEAPVAAEEDDAGAPDDGGDVADPEQEEAGSVGGAGSGGGSAQLARLPAGGGGEAQVVDGVGCAYLGGSSLEADVTVTIAEVRLAPEGTSPADGPCDGEVCAGLVWSSSFGGCVVPFVPAPGATSVTVELFGSVVCDDPAECDAAYAFWGASGGSVLEFRLVFDEGTDEGTDEGADEGSDEDADEGADEPEPEEAPATDGG